ncbi:MAG: MBL fold metallo-hydrolase [Gemmatimonadota bacterium]
MRPYAAATVLALASLACAPSAVVQEEHRRCEDAVAVTYLANASVLLRGTSRVLIDGPFTTGVEPYPRYRPDALRAARDADGPFAEVEWILVTHAHADHMDADAIVEHLRSNGRARVASTREAIERIARASGGDPAIVERLVAVAPAEAASTVVHPRGPRIEALALHHGRDRDIVNIGFLVDVDGVRFLHPGDSEATAPEFRALSMPARDIDVALIPTWYYTSPTYRPALEHVNARTMLAMHFPAPAYEGGFVGRLGGWSEVRRFLERFDPPPVPLTERGATLCIDGA